MPKVEKVCPICSKAFLSYAYLNRIYCYRGCYGKSRTAPEKKEATGDITECFAMGLHRCIILEGVCRDTECPFYKTIAQLQEGRRRVYERICELPPGLREHIIFKYYGGLENELEGLSSDI